MRLLRRLVVLLLVFGVEAEGQKLPETAADVQRLLRTPGGFDQLLALPACNDSGAYGCCLADHREGTWTCGLACTGGGVNDKWDPPQGEEDVPCFLPLGHPEPCFEWSHDVDAFPVTAPPVPPAPAPAMVRQPEVSVYCAGPRVGGGTVAVYTNTTGCIESTCPSVQP